MISIGGIFIKAKSDQQTLLDWYAKHLGISFENWGGTVLNTEGEGPLSVHFSVFKPDTDYFATSDSPFMINFRVEDLAGLLDRLRADGVTVLGGPKEYAPYGYFAWVLDPDGNKIELWEPAKEE